MKKILISILFILSCFSSVFGSDSELVDVPPDFFNDLESDPFSLGMTYYNDMDEVGLQKNLKEAVHWFKKSADQGNPDAECMLGWMHDFFHLKSPLPQSCEKAAYWYKRAANQGHAKAQCLLGEMYCKRFISDYTIMLFRCSSKEIVQDFKKAVYWFKRSAEQGYANAQTNLGAMYYEGKGVTQDYKQALHWYNKAAKQGFNSAQFNIGTMYYEGKGIPKNYKLAYVWFSLAAQHSYPGTESAINNRDITANKLSSEQLSEAQELASKIQYKIDHRHESKEESSLTSKKQKKIRGSGTGFIITKDGYILTCHHVIKDATKMEVAIGEKNFPATLVRVDPNNDIALLKIKGSFPAIAFSSKRSAKLGEKVFTIGFPNPSLQGVNAKYTEGTINSLTGFQDDVRLYQISIPVQPGNSGGALIDKNGNILGIIVAMLNAQTTFKLSGSLPQNVNYAIKALYAQAMLDTLPEVSSKLISESKGGDSAVKRTKNATVLILSYEE